MCKPMTKPVWVGFQPVPGRALQHPLAHRQQLSPADFNAVFRDPKMLELMDVRYVETSVATRAEFTAFLKTDRGSAGSLVRLASQAAY